MPKPKRARYKEHKSKSGPVIKLKPGDPLPPKEEALNYDWGDTWASLPDSDMPEAESGVMLNAGVREKGTRPPLQGET